MPDKSDLLQGTLDMLILKIVALGPVHGYGISLRIRDISREVIQVQQGSLYPALHRLEARGWLEAEWGESDNGRQAKFYKLSAVGRKQLAAEESNWNRLSEAVGTGFAGGELAMFSHKKPGEKQLDLEIGFHIEALVRENIAAGMSATEARRQAMLDFGGREQVKEEIRDVRRMPWLESVAANLKAAVRFARKSPVFSLTVVGTLALGVGANTAVFSAIDAILLRPLPFPRSGELVLLEQRERMSKSASSFVAPPRLEDWNRMSSTMQAVSGWYTSDVSDFSGPLPEKVTEALVAPRFLQVWGIAPAMGRSFTPLEERFAGPNAVLISDRYWRTQMHADPSAVGKTVRLNKTAFTVVGVMPASFRFPVRDVDVWLPSPVDAPYAQSRQSTWFTVIARMKPGVTAEQARADLSVAQAQLAKQFPKSDGKLTVDVKPLKEQTIGKAGRSLWVLFGSVSLLLTIACINIAALMLARTREREREISVRFSLGASRGTLIAQLLTECFVLALAGSGAGLFLAWGGAKALRSLANSIPRADEVGVNVEVLIYTLACALVATLLFGLAPAIRATRRNISGQLAQAGRTQVSTRNPLQWVLVGVQVSLAVTLLTGAGLLVRSFEQLGRVSPGFDPSGVTTLKVSGNWGETVEYPRLTARIDRTMEALRQIPGVEGVATSDSLPGMAHELRSEINLLDVATNRKVLAQNRIVSNGYFSTLKIPLLAGEACRVSDKPLATALVNRSFANTYPGAEPGRHLQLSSTQFSTGVAEIKGIVGDAREAGLDHEPEPTVYWCMSAPTPFPDILVRAPLNMSETLRRRIREIEPGRAVYGISSLEDRLSDSFAENRLRTILLSLFALTAVALVCVGLYGALSYVVTLRRREVGLRLALGALPGEVVSRFLSEALGVALVGCGVGLAMALAAGHVLAGMLYGVTPTDAPTFCAVALGVMLVAALSCTAPALRAARVIPMDVLRDE